MFLTFWYSSPRFAIPAGMVRGVFTSPTTYQYTVPGNLDGKRGTGPISSSQDLYGLVCSIQGLYRLVQVDIGPIPSNIWYSPILGFFFCFCRFFRLFL